MRTRTIRIRNHISDLPFKVYIYVVNPIWFEAGCENWDDEGLENTPIIEGIDNSYAHIVPVGQTFKPDKRGVKVQYSTTHTPP